MKSISALKSLPFTTRLDLPLHRHDHHAHDWNGAAASEQKQRVQRRTVGQAENELETALDVAAIHLHLHLFQRLNHLARRRDGHRGADVELQVDTLKHCSLPVHLPAE
jgi:hypothetical protein